MNDNVYASRFVVSILNQDINNVLNVLISTDNESFNNMVHIPCYNEPTLLKDNITVSIADEVQDV